MSAARRKQRAVAAALVVLALTTSTCVHKDPIVLSALEARIQSVGALWNRYSPQDQAIIRNGGVRVGLDETALYLARGEPAFYWRSQLAPGRVCNVLLHGRSAPTAQVDLVAYSCDGLIVHLAVLDPVLPCWRLQNVVPRIIERAAYFDGLPLVRQWEIVDGILRRGWTDQDLYVAFGQPYNVGSEAREDGTNAQTQVFLDHTGEAYGLHVTLVSSNVVGWQIPAERQLTPEAQQRRLQATEERLMAQMQQMEAQSLEQHRQEMALLNEMQTQADQLLNTVAAGATAAAAALPAGGGAPAPDGGGFVDPSAVSGSSSLTINGCAFTDTPQGELGLPCGDPAAGTASGCSAGYTCWIFLPGAMQGVCVPADQLGNCSN